MKAFSSLNRIFYILIVVIVALTQTTIETIRGMYVKRIK